MPAKIELEQGGSLAILQLISQAVASFTFGARQPAPSTSPGPVPATVPAPSPPDIGIGDLLRRLAIFLINSISQ